MSAPLFTRWFTRWRRKPAQSGPALPLGLAPQEIAALRVLQASPQWKHYVSVLERVGEQQASELASGLAHDRYLFACGALHAIRRIYTVVDDLLASATQLEEFSDARSRTAAVQRARASTSFLNTPWYDSWFAERSRTGSD